MKFNIFEEYKLRTTTWNWNGLDGFTSPTTGNVTLKLWNQLNSVRDVEANWMLLVKVLKGKRNYSHTKNKLGFIKD